MFQESVDCSHAFLSLIVTMPTHEICFQASIQQPHGYAVASYRQYVSFRWLHQPLGTAKMTVQKFYPQTGGVFERFRLEPVDATEPSFSTRSYMKGQADHSDDNTFTTQKVLTNNSASSTTSLDRSTRHCFRRDHCLKRRQAVDEHPLPR